jgi:hypothetical protein
MVVWVSWVVAANLETQQNWVRRKMVLTPARTAPRRSRMSEAESKSGECVGLPCTPLFSDPPDSLVRMGLNPETMVCSFLHIKCCFNLTVTF